MRDASRMLLAVGDHHERVPALQIANFPLASRGGDDPSRPLEPIGDEVLITVGRMAPVPPDTTARPGTHSGLPICVESDDVLLGLGSVTVTRTVEINGFVYLVSAQTQTRASPADALAIVNRGLAGLR